MPPPYRDHLAPVPTPEPAAVEIKDQYTGSDQNDGEFLLTVWTDGSHTIAWRGRSWETWSPPIELKKEARA